MIRYIAILILSLLPMAAGAVSPDKVPNVHVMRADAWVSDPDGLLSDEARRRADAVLDSLSNATTAEVTVAVVADLDGQDIDSYATELFELWGIGKKDRDNGLLMVISRDDRRAAIRTGYGMEGIINDARAGRIIRQDIAPNMKAGDIDNALLQAVNAISMYVTDPKAADYLHSDRETGREDVSLADFLRVWLSVSFIVVVALLAWLLLTYIATRHESDPRRYARLDSMRLPFLMSIPVTLGFGCVAWVALWLMMRRVRLHRHDCPNCGTRMHRVDEIHDNDYLTPAQDMEEKLNSVDYDVWLCPACNETDILPYINRRSSYTVCPDCGARARSLVANRILRQPTTRYEGQGVRLYRCNNCGKETQTPYNIAKIVEPPIVIVGGGGGGRGFGGGGGFSGGSFGGGMTGGGGASGGW
ncbi:MAG: TPM domain-containing protein [Muribaculaceae bacterium]|nr:TPM domain-containing protein [Muribaculaceae bacterium]